MIQFGLILLLGGVSGAVIRHYKIKKNHSAAIGKDSDENSGVDVFDEKKIPVTQESLQDYRGFDDVGELDHYQKVSWYTLALIGSGSLFYAPVIWLGLPLLGYNTYHFVRTLQHSTPGRNRSALTIFEVVGVAGTIITFQPLMTSVILSFSFGARNLLLQAGNISNNINFSDPINLRHAPVWVLRDGAEIEINVSMLQKDDIVVLHQGDMIIIEGVVVEGQGLVRQFSLEKVMKQVPKMPGEKVYPFTLLDSGSIRIIKS